MAIVIVSQILETAIMPEPRALGRFSVEFAVANNHDALNLPVGDRAVLMDCVKHVVLPGMVDSGASRLALPPWVVDELQWQVEGESAIRHADRWREKRPVVSNVWLELAGQHGFCSAVVEPGGNDAWIGATFLEELDLLVDLVDCAARAIYPREPDSSLTDVE